jgi:hypothetical protein
MQVVQQGTIVKHLKQHLPILEEYPTLHNDLVTMLQKMISVGQMLSTSIVQLILRVMIKSFVHDILWIGHGGHNHKGMDKIVFETLHKLVFSHGNHRS